MKEKQQQLLYWLSLKRKQELPLYLSRAWGSQHVWGVLWEFLLVQVLQGMHILVALKGGGEGLLGSAHQVLCCTSYIHMIPWWYKWAKSPSMDPEGSWVKTEVVLLCCCLHRTMQHNSLYPFLWWQNICYLCLYSWMWIPIRFRYELDIKVLSPVKTRGLVHRCWNMTSRLLRISRSKTAVQGDFRCSGVRWQLDRDFHKGTQFCSQGNPLLDLDCALVLPLQTGLNTCSLARPLWRLINRWELF